MCTFYIYKTETLLKRYCLSFKRTFVYFARLKNEKRIYNVYWDKSSEVQNIEKKRGKRKKGTKWKFYICI